MDHLCRFCGLNLADAVKYEIRKTAVVIQFLNLLPCELLVDENRLPKNCCDICNTKIVEFIKFHEEILATDRNLRNMLKMPQINTNHVRLRRLSELVKYKNVLSEPDKLVKPQSVSVSEIYDKLKAKSSITISKFVDEISEDTKEDTLINSDSDSDYSEPKNVVVMNSSSDDSDCSNNEKPEISKRQRTVVKNPRIISLENLQPNFVCVRCRAKFKSVEALHHHLKTNNECKDTDILCGDCKKQFKTRRLYSKHVREVHQKKETPIFKCTNCEAIFPRESELINHRVLCTGVCNEDFSGILFKCKDCDKSFERRIELVKHIENHTKQLLCETCGKSCKTKKAYSTHVREHLGLKPHKCTMCEKQFRTNTLLQAHQHVHTGVKLYVCDTCGKTFAKRASLVYHVRLHTGEKPYPCDLCEERFTSSERLKNHLRKHRQNFYNE